MNKKIWILSAMTVVGLIPLTASAWHGGWDYYDAPRHHRYYEDCPMRHHAGPAPRGPHGYHMGWDGPQARTFGMTAEEVRGFMAEVGGVLNIETKQKSAWDALTKAYEALATQRMDRPDRVQAREMTSVERLQARNAFMQAHAKAFDGYVKAREQFEKVATPEQAQRLDEIMATGGLYFDRPRAPRGPQSPR